MGGFLTPGLGYRRFLILEPQHITHDYSETINPNDLWAEALYLYENGYPYRWNQPDFDDFLFVNQRYIQENLAQKYIKLYLAPPSHPDKGEYLQPREILAYLVKDKLRREDRTRISEIEIGKALTSLNYTRKKVRRGSQTIYAYHVSFL
jgi:hypothetical protein